MISWYQTGRATFFAAQTFHCLSVQPDPAEPPSVHHFLLHQGGGRWGPGTTTHSNQPLQCWGSLEHICTENHPHFKYCLLWLGYAFFKKTEHAKMTMPCTPCLLLIKRTHKRLQGKKSGHLSLQIQGGDVGGESNEWLLWESPSLSGYFLALFSLLSSNLFAVSALKRPQSFCQPGTEVLGQFLPGNAVLRGRSSSYAEPALTAICCRVSFVAGQEVIWGF